MPLWLEGLTQEVGRAPAGHAQGPGPLTGPGGWAPLPREGHHDLLCVGPKSVVEEFLGQLSGKVTLKRTGSVNSKSWVRFCGFEYKRSEYNEYIKVRSPESYIEGMLKIYNLDGPKVKGVTTPAECERSEPEAESLDAAEHARYRAAVGKLIWYSQQRLDIVSAVRRVAMSVSQPTTADVQRVKRLLRYVVMTREFCQVIYPLPSGDEVYVHAFGDASWAPLRGDRRSVSGVVIKLGVSDVIEEGMVTLHASSKMQDIIAQSAAEAELYAATLAVQSAYFLRSVLAEVGLYQSAAALCHCDSAAVIQNSHKLGLGSMRHLELKRLWLQQEVRAGRVALQKVKGTENPADGGTKALQGRLSSASGTTWMSGGRRRSAASR